MGIGWGWVVDHGESSKSYWIFWILLARSRTRFYYTFNQNEFKIEIMKDLVDIEQ